MNGFDLAARRNGMGETTRIGIVGAGNISETHARAAQSITGVEIVAVWGANRQKTEDLAAIFPGYARRVELTGSEGTVVLENDSLLAVDTRSASPDLQAASLASAAQDRNSPVVGDASAHRRIIADFIAAIGSGAAPACDAREGRRSVELVQAIYRSSREARAVTLR